MKWLILVGLILVVLFEYACLAISKEADRQANEMYNKWKEEHDNERIHTKR